MKNLFSVTITVAIAITTAIMFSNCSPASSGSDTAGGGAGLSEFASVLSEDMVLTSPTAQRSGASILSSRYFVMGDVVVMGAPAADDSPKEKKDALEDLLADTAPASCAIALTIQNSGRANCYGPSVDYTNHDDGAPAAGQYPGGDLGIWEESEVSGEACAAAQLTQQMKGVISYADVAQFIGAGIACVANKKGSALPAAPGVQLDLTADMAGIVTINSAALTVAFAQIERVADSSGNPVYVTTMNGSAGGSAYEIRIKHVSTATDDSTNMGKISVIVDNGTNSTNGVSLEYVKASATSGKFLLKKTGFNTSGVVPFVSGTDYSVDFSKPWTGDANYFIAEIDPTKYTGKFAYAWQAGNGDSDARVFNAILSESGGVVTGSAFFGFGPKVQVGAGAIDKMICNWSGPNNNHTGILEVQRQDMTLTSGKFVLTGTSATVFDPVLLCESSSAMAMTWGMSGSRTVVSTTKNLRPLAEVASTVGALPTAPVNVD